MSYVGVMEYFLIDCRTRQSRSIFKFNVTHGCPGVFLNGMSHVGVQENENNEKAEGAEGLNIIEHY